MNIRFFLVRHGIKEKIMGDVPITLEGIKQAQLTAQYLSSMPITEIVSSPLRRAIETAEHISSKTKSRLRIDSRLRERANWGDSPGQTFEEFVEIWEKCTREPDYIPPVGDSARQACVRLSSLLSDLVQEYPSGSNIVIVTHGGLITDYIVNTFPESELNRFHINFIDNQTNLVSECSITEFNFENNSYTIERFASVKHLSCLNVRNANP